MKYADVIVNITARALDRTFQYAVPADLETKIEAGSIVSVRFGSKKEPVRAYVVGVSDTPAIAPERIRPIESLVTEGSGAQENLIALAAWIRDRYGSTMLQALKTVIPAGTTGRIREKMYVCLAVSEESAQHALDAFRVKKQSARARLMEALLRDRELPQEVVTGKLNVTTAAVRALEEKGLVRREARREVRAEELPGSAGLTLTEPQQAAVDRVLADWAERTEPQQAAEKAPADRTDRPAPQQAAAEQVPAGRPRGSYLLFGVTGSGKTEVYMTLIAEVIRRGYQAIVLIPEIALTYQTLMRFYRRFGSRAALIHSRMSKGERSEQFERARRGEIDVMIGPRSALFTPFPRLGMIVIDEEHEEAYRSEQAPRYLAREVALRRAETEGACLMLGSATPSLESYHAALSGEMTLLKLPNRAAGAELPETRIIDMRVQGKRGNASLLSGELQSAIAERLARKEQIMLFLNRRGYAGFVSCRACGHVMRCPHCDVSMTWHEGRGLVCHYCGHEEPMPQRCPACGSGFISAWKAGTEKVEEETRALFPGARMLRMDRDTTARQGSHEEILSAFAQGQADILIGTQMIVKGHDFPNVTLVGILAADLSLNAPDLRAAERTFQLLTQAAGRAGRGARKGLTLIQTYEPEHYSIQTAARQDYEAFYETEMAQRLMTLYPPAGALLSIHLSCEDQAHLVKAAGYLKALILKMKGEAPLRVLGPADEPIARLRDRYRMAIYLKYTDGAYLTAVKNRLERYIEANEGFASVEVLFDVGR